MKAHSHLLIGTAIVILIIVLVFLFRKKQKGLAGIKFKKTTSGKALVKMLKKNGWKVISQSGSHIKVEKKSIHVTIPNHKEIKKGTYHSIIKKITFVENLKK